MLTSIIKIVKNAFFYEKIKKVKKRSTKNVADKLTKLSTPNEKILQ